MFGKIIDISDNTVFVENLTGQLQYQLKGIHVAFPEKTTTVIGKIIEIKKDMIQIYIVGEIIDGKFVMGIFKAPTLTVAPRIVTGEELVTFIGNQNYHATNTLLIGDSTTYDNFKAVHDNHVNMLNIIQKLNITGVDGILLDLGVSSYQLDEPSRGFSYMHDAPLDMRMNKEDILTAKDIVNKYSEEELVKIFFDYGEEKFSKQIARKIVESRDNKEIETTLELVDIIKSSVPKKALIDKGHPAKRVFQAIRIEVNSEIKLLENGIRDAVKALNTNGRLCVISFHSLEDRIVKKVFEEMQGKCTCPKDLPKCVCNYVSYGKIITKKPILPTEEEMSYNSRSKSAKLRVFERI